MDATEAGSVGHSGSKEALPKNMIEGEEQEEKEEGERRGEKGRDKAQFSYLLVPTFFQCS